jgi:hypothetical protein
MSIASSFCRGFALVSLSGALVLAQHGGGHGGGAAHVGAGSAGFRGGGGFVGHPMAPIKPTAQGLSGFPASAYSIGIPASASSISIPASAYSLNARPSTFSTIRPGYPAYGGFNYASKGSGHRRGRYGYPLVYGYLAAPYYPFWDYSNYYDNSGYPAYPTDPGPEAGPAPSDNNGVGDRLAQLSSQVNDLQNQLAQRPAPDSTSAPGTQQASPSPSSPPLTVVLKSGQTLQVQNYAVMGNVLWDLSSQPTRKIPFSNIDVPASTKATEASGAEFPNPGV